MQNTRGSATHGELMQKAEQCCVGHAAKSVYLRRIPLLDTLLLMYCPITHSSFEVGLGAKKLLHTIQHGMHIALFQLWGWPGLGQLLAINLRQFNGSEVCRKIEADCSPPCHESFLFQ